MDYATPSGLRKGPLVISMAQYSPVLTIHWVSSFFNWAEDLFQGFCSRDDSGIVGYRFALSGIVMYFEAQRQENDDGLKSWYILTRTTLYGYVFHSTWNTRSVRAGCTTIEIWRLHRQCRERQTYMAPYKSVLMTVWKYWQNKSLIARVQKCPER